MNIEIIDSPFIKDIYGFSGIAVKNQYGETGFKLMDKMWKLVKGNSLKNKGINIWVYEGGGAMFAGVELESPPAEEIGLELKKIKLPRYAHYKHIGPYNKLSEAYSKTMAELAEKGYKACFPQIEMYGHWTSDETKAETDILICV